ncbi:gll1793 [Gloeobacter violaceus PCC 7421]|uniref:Gll1793 protein n=1 Tax=Gloeobacter violaceus (strain ATCC 29082 / PCC 7421) TaxID=251221 RepID=Q7NJN9_GLOVI|nr:gll1793 [Gloeobacter violaceus PCC 7421]
MIVSHPFHRLRAFLQRLPLRGRLAQGSALLLGAFVLVKASQFVIQILLSRLLSPSDFGLWAMVLVLTGLSLLFRDGTIAAVLVQRGLDDKRMVDAVYSLGVNVSVGLFVLQVLASYPLSLFFGEPILWPLTALHGTIFLINAGTGAHDSVLLRQMRFREIALCDCAAGGARLVGAVACALAGGGVWAFAAGEIAYAAADAVARRRASGYHFRYSFWPDPQAIQAVRRYIADMMSINLAVQTNTNGDNLVIGRLLGAEPLGFYNVAYQLAMVPVFALTKVNRVHFTALSHMDRAEQQSYVGRALEQYALLGAPVYALSFVLAPWLVPFIYGQEWAEAAVLFQLVLIFAYARGLMSIIGTALNAFDKPGINARINWVLVPLTLPSYVLGAWLGGVVGVAIAVALVMGAGATGWFWVAVCRTSGWNLGVPAKPVLLPTLAAVGAAGCAALLALPPVAAAALVVALYMLFASLAIVRIFGLEAQKPPFKPDELAKIVSSTTRK